MPTSRRPHLGIHQATDMFNNPAAVHGLVIFICWSALNRSRRAGTYSALFAMFCQASWQGVCYRCEPLGGALVACDLRIGVLG